LGHGKIHREFLNEGIVMKENITNSDDIVLSEIVYDTNTVKLNGSINSIYSVSDHITFMEFRDDLTSPKNAVEGDFKSFYENGQVHAAGVLSSSKIKPKMGEWVYYNPEGEVVNKVTYNVNFDLEGDLKHLDSYGDISFYENGELVSRGLIIDLIEKFNCASADNYEIRQIVITEDINNGQVTKNPSRYHKSYYDMGVLQSEGELKNGVPVGIWKFYDRQGGLRSLGNYVNGRKDGRWLEGDLTGLGFIGDFCIAPDNYEINKELLESNVNLTIKFFSAGSLIKKDEFKARLEK
jgi:antitoxin component YwqK of YwqJK toxin-antitoxin module